MIKISHEIPISMLKDSRNFNDYDYCLCHLYDDDERTSYKEFYDESVSKNRHVILDNSIYELGKTFDPDKYAAIVEKLNPTEYIVPDEFDDAEKTLHLREEWHRKYEKKFTSKPISVVHGKTYKEIKKCMEGLLKYEGRIAFNFADSVYLSHKSHGHNADKNIALNRCEIIQKLDEDFLLPYNRQYHLLGCTLPQEYVWANKYAYLKHMFTSADTSSPIVHGLLDIEYRQMEDCTYGIDSKKQIKLNDLIDKIPTESQLKRIHKNIKMFKKNLQQSDYGGRK